MGFVSILDQQTVPYEDFSLPTVLIDLNLDQVVRKLQMDWPEDVQRFFYYLPPDRETADYRRAIYADIQESVKTDKASRETDESYEADESDNEARTEAKTEVRTEVRTEARTEARTEVGAEVRADAGNAVADVLERFVERMRRRAQAEENRAAVYHKLQKDIWFLIATATYCDACTKLYEDLHSFSFSSKGMRSLQAELRDLVFSKEYREMSETAHRLREELHSFRLTLTYENERIVVKEEAKPGVYEGFLTEAFGESKESLRSPFLKSKNLTNLEQEIIGLFQGKHKEFFGSVTRFVKKHEIYAKDWVLRLSKEVVFYLSFHKFQKQMQDKGFAFARPTTDEGSDMKASGLYDLALALVNSSQEKEVISNEMNYLEGEHFFVLTGPNQGGKTTFARSLGQLVYFTKLGLEVPARSAKVPHFTRILTHFSVEESVETGRGKLKEELVRLKPMMEEGAKGAFVIINELFTTAANYDACLMGKRVLEHFISEGSRGIYVTHLKELAEERHGVVSLRAMTDEKRQASFRIIRREADDSACAQNQVNKYKLTYEQLRERLHSK